MKSAPTIAFDYRPSRWIAAAAGAVCIAATAAPWLAGVPVGWRIAASVSILVAGCVSVRRFLAIPFRRIACRASGWTLVDRGDADRAAILASHVHLGSWLVLDFKLDRGGRFRAVLGPDNLDAETRRRLILLLSRAEIAHAG